MAIITNASSDIASALRQTSARSVRQTRNRQGRKRDGKDSIAMNQRRLLCFQVSMNVLAAVHHTYVHNLQSSILHLSNLNMSMLYFDHTV